MSLRTVALEVRLGDVGMFMSLYDARPPDVRRLILFDEGLGGEVTKVVQSSRRCSCDQSHHAKACMRAMTES